jgi:hypothetical protein
MNLLEQIARDDAIQERISHPHGPMSETRSLLDAPAGAVNEFSPTIPRYWDWDQEVDYQFDLDGDVEQRIRGLVAEEGIDDDLSSDWAIDDLTL